MGRVAPSPENVLAGYQNVPKFGGLKKDETARINLIEFGEAKAGEAFGSWAEFVHNLQVQAVEETRPDGSTYEVKARQWFGSYICTGRDEVLAEKGFDSEACPCCARADEDESFKPQRRHATNIVVYGTTPGSFKLMTPWQIQVKPWVFHERKFRQLTELHEMWKDLRRHDLMLTCTSGAYQNYDIAAGPDAAWLDPANNPAEGVDRHTGNSLTMLVAETVKTSKLDDDGLSNCLGSKVPRTTLLQKVTEYAAALGMASAMSSETGAPASQPMGAEALADMLGGSQAAASPMEASETAPEVAPAAAEPAPVAAAPPSEPSTTQSIDDLLS